MNKQFLLIGLLIVSIAAFSQCPKDNRTLTEIVFQNNATVFSCTILSSKKDTKGNIFSKVKINEVFLGLIKDSIETLSNGNIYSKENAGLMLKEGSKLLYYGDKGLSCCTVCDQWSKEINDSNSSKEEIKILRQFAEVFKKKKSGKYNFYWNDTVLIAKGMYSKGRPIGDWRHYNSNGKLIFHASFPIEDAESKYHFKIKQSDAIEIAKKNRFLHDTEGYFINVDSVNWTITLDENMGEIKSVTINAQTGEQSQVKIMNRID